MAGPLHQASFGWHPPRQHFKPHYPNHSMQTGWRRRQWPPRPSVEDEVESLAHEFASSSLSVTKDDDAQSRGSVDQLPIILDAFPTPEASQQKARKASRHADHGSMKSNSSVESLGPPTPTDTNHELRYVYIPHKGVEIPITYSDDNLKAGTERAEGSRSSNTQEESRGRQKSIPRIDTDLGADLQNLADTRRRAPSPYSFVKPEKTASSSREFFLSPDASTPTARFPNLDAKRPASARPVPRKKEDSSDSSDSGLRPPERRRSTRYSYTNQERPSLSAWNGGAKPSHDQRSASYSFPKKDAAPVSKKSLLSDGRSPRQDSRSSKPNSPYQSSDESSKSRLNVSDPRRGTRSARPSFSRQDRPKPVIVDPRHSYDASIPSESREHHRKHHKHGDASRHYSVYDGRGYLEPSSGKSPKAMEDYFEKAFQDNCSRRNASPRTSPNASPFSSPPRTPPRSPTVESSFVPMSRQRQATKGDLKPLTPMTPMTNSARSSHDLLPARTDTYPLPNGRKSKASSPLSSPVEERRMDPRFSIQSPSPMPVLMTGRSTNSHSSGDERDPRRSSTLPVTPKTFEPKQPPPQRPFHSTPASTDVVPRLPPQEPHTGPNPLQLAPCPRTKPVAGYHDWYTIRGFPNLNFCPSCMGQIGGSKFRDYFIPSLPKPRGQEVRCALSHPWMRVAWVQTIKQRRDNLNLLYRIHDLSETAQPCSGKEGAIRPWYRVPDPLNGNAVPNFDACSTCVRSVEILMPELRGVFKRGNSLVQERTCDLRCDSKRFSSYVNLLDAAATKAFDEDRDPDMRAFADHARRTAAIRECCKDSLVLGQAWHFVPSLPEFTVCEECYEEVVRPLSSEPIASRLNRTAQLIGPAERGISCQLYSARMRKIFREAVKYNDFEFLKAEALRRHRVEKLLQERHALLMREYPDQKRAEDLARNVEKWRIWE